MTWHNIIISAASTVLTAHNFKCVCINRSSTMNNLGWQMPLHHATLKKFNLMGVVGENFHRKWKCLLSSVRQCQLLGCTYMSLCFNLDTRSIFPFICIHTSFIASTLKQNRAWCCQSLESGMVSNWIIDFNCVFTYGLPNLHTGIEMMKGMSAVWCLLTGKLIHWSFHQSINISE